MTNPQSSFKLLDGTSIPWLGWGPGNFKPGKLALEAGIRHIDTAQIYGTEEATGKIVASSPIPKSEIYVTSKLWGPVSVDQVRQSVETSVKKLGFVPDLFLIHNPFVANPGELEAVWKVFEALKGEGKLKSIGVSNFRPQDLETILAAAKHKPVVNQIEYHPYVLAHLDPLLALQKHHGILTEAYGPLTPILRHPTGGPLKPVLERIAARLSKETRHNFDATAVLLLWTRATGAVAVTGSSKGDHIKALAQVSRLADVLRPDEVEEITRIGKTVHFRHYREHMEKDFPVPDLPDGAEVSS